MYPYTINTMPFQFSVFLNLIRRYFYKWNMLLYTNISIFIVFKFKYFGGAFNQNSFSVLRYINIKEAEGKFQLKKYLSISDTFNNSISDSHNIKKRRKIYFINKWCGGMKNEIMNKTI